MASANVTRRALTLGTRDPTTDWKEKIFTNSTITGSFDPATAREAALTLGVPLNKIPFYSRPFFTSCYIRRGDHILHDVIGEVELVAVSPVTWLNEFVFYACQCSEVLMPSDRAATSGTWHTDSEAIKTDPRNRIKSWLDSYLSYAVCDYQTMFAGIDYPMEREFVDEGLEIVSAIDLGQSQPEYNYNHKPYKFMETTTITNTAKDTAALTATNILESFEQSIRDVATDHPLGSIRRIRSTDPKRVDIGGMWLWQNTITIEYERSNDDYAPTYPRITWGPSATPTGTFYFPNCTRIRYPNGVPDIKLLPPGREGNIHQIMGDTSLAVELTCDLDVEPSAKTWKRPQTTTPKTDNMNWQVFLDIKHNGGIIAGTQPYQTLTLDWGSFPVRLVYFDPDEAAESHVLRLIFEEYCSVDQSAYTVLERYNIT